LADCGLIFITKLNDRLATNFRHSGITLQKITPSADEYTSIYSVKFPILVTTFWTWLSIVGLSMTPNLVLGPSAAVGVGIAAHYNPWVLLPVVAVAGYFEGLVVAWLAGESTRIGFIDRWVTRLRTPRSVALTDKWGVWGGLTLGCAVVGQEPILVALRWLGVDMRRIWLPLAVSNVVFAVLYYAIVWFGLVQVAKL
jgi:hypothetical protein